MPLPLIPIIIGVGSTLLGALGIKKGFDANKNFDKAKKIGDKAQTWYNEKKKEFESAESETKRASIDLTVFKRKIYSTTVQDFIKLFEKFKKIELTDLKLTSFNSKFSVAEISNFKQQALNFEDSAKGLLSASVTGAAAGFGSLGLVGAIGTASTGTAISTLAGAAASNATMAWLGGGALSAGGFGVAGGTAILGGIVVGPALAVGGFFLAGKSEIALTDAIDYEKRAKVAVEEIKKALGVLKAINNRIKEIDKVASLVNEKLILKLVSLTEIDKRLGSKNSYETKDLDENDKKTLFITFTLAKALKSILEVPILDRAGKASNESKKTCDDVKITMDKLNV